MKILIVDDEVDQRAWQAELLREEGHDVQEGENGHQCLDIYKKFQPDIIILDVFMPNKDGVETLIELRKSGCESCVIMCSGGGLSKNYDFLSITDKFGADFILKKPIMPDELLEYVDRCKEK